MKPNSRFISSNPCKRCGGGERYMVNNCCVACTKQRVKNPRPKTFKLVLACCGSIRCISALRDGIYGVDIRVHRKDLKTGVLSCTFCGIRTQSLEPNLAKVK